MRPAASSPLTHAMTSLAQGDAWTAVQQWRQTGIDDNPRSQAAAAILARVVGDQRSGSPPPLLTAPTPGCPVADRLWAADPEAAARLVASGGPLSMPVPVAEGIIAALREQWPLAYDLLRPVAQGEAALHLAHVCIRLGRFQEARTVLNETLEPDSFGRHLLEAWVGLVSDVHSQAGLAQWWLRATKAETLFGGVLHNDVPKLVSATQFAQAARSPAAVAEMLGTLLQRCAGNLGQPATLAALDSTGHPTWFRPPLDPPSRTRSTDALQQLKYRDYPHVLQDLTTLVHTCVGSAQPLCYRGELLLWHGDYALALADFVRARGREAARWSDIGTVAALTFLGHLRAARAAAFYAQRHYPPLAAGTLSAYLGVLALERGELDKAIYWLEAALAAKPGRVGSQVDLAVAYHRAGRLDQAQTRQVHLFRDAAPLMMAAADLAVPDWPTAGLRPEHHATVLDAARVMLRGNRSSSLWTWVGGDGQIRVLVPLHQLVTQARKWLAQTS